MPLMATFVVDHVVGGANGMEQSFFFIFLLSLCLGVPPIFRSNGELNQHSIMTHQISIIPSHLIHKRYELPPLRHILVPLLAKVRCHHDFLVTGACGEDPVQHRAVQQHHRSSMDQIERKQCLDPGQVLVKQCALERDHAEKRAPVGRVSQILIRPCLDQTVVGHNLDDVPEVKVRVIRQRLKEKRTLN